MPINLALKQPIMNIVNEGINVFSNSQKDNGHYMPARAVELMQEVFKGTGLEAAANNRYQKFMELSMQNPNNTFSDGKGMSLQEGAQGLFSALKQSGLADLLGKSKDPLAKSFSEILNSKNPNAGQAFAALLFDSNLFKKKEQKEVAQVPPSFSPFPNQII